jgi:hypothetical protein
MDVNVRARVPDSSHRLGLQNDQIQNPEAKRSNSTHSAERSQPLLLFHIPLFKVESLVLNKHFPPSWAKLQLMRAQDKRPFSFDLVESLKGKIEHKIVLMGDSKSRFAQNYCNKNSLPSRSERCNTCHQAHPIPCASDDNYLASTLWMFITSKNSPAQMIQFRSYFAVKFEKFRHETRDGNVAWLD